VVRREHRRDVDASGNKRGPTSSPATRVGAEAAATATAACEACAAPSAATTVAAEDQWSPVATVAPVPAIPRGIGTAQRAVATRSGRLGATTEAARTRHSAEGSTTPDPGGCGHDRAARSAREAGVTANTAGRIAVTAVTSAPTPADEYDRTIGHKVLEIVVDSRRSASAPTRSGSRRRATETSEVEPVGEVATAGPLAANDHEEILPGDDRYNPSDGVAAATRGS
jgi:hypothetical protein